MSETSLEGLMLSLCMKATLLLLLIRMSAMSVMYLGKLRLNAIVGAVVLVLAPVVVIAHVAVIVLVLAVVIALVVVQGGN